MWLNCWEERVEKKTITKDEYLLQNTVDGLCVTIKSTIELFIFWSNVILNMY